MRFLRILLMIVSVESVFWSGVVCAGNHHRILAFVLAGSGAMCIGFFSRK